MRALGAESGKRVLLADLREASRQRFGLGYLRSAHKTLPQAQLSMPWHAKKTFCLCVTRAADREPSERANSCGKDDLELETQHGVLREGAFKYGRMDFQSLDISLQARLHLP